MKPFGTITKDFQFVEVGTREILEEIMEISPDYSEFTRILCKKAMLESATDEIILAAIQHVTNLSFSELEWKLYNAQGDRMIVQSYLLAKQASDDYDWELAVRAFEDAIDQSKTDWESLLHLLQLYRISILRRYGSPLEERTQKRIEGILRNNPALEGHSPRFYLDQTVRLRYEGNVNLALTACDKGLLQTERIDDKLFEIRLLWQRAELIGVYSFGPGSTAEAKQILSKAGEICENIGDTMGLVRIHSLVQVMCHMRGEYSEAYEISLENVRAMESIGEQADVDIHNLSAICNEMGRGKEALEWAKQAMKAYENKPLIRPVAYLDVAWSLINLDKLDEAGEQIALAREYLHKSGYESVVAIDHMVSGLLERGQGDFDSALSSLENALNINLRENRHNRVTSCIIKLAETEVIAFEPSSLNIDHETSGEWLTKLDKFGQDMELPGVNGLVMYLKGELRLKQGRHCEGYEYANQVLKMSGLPGLAYLKDKAQLIHEVSIPRKKK